MAGTVLTYTFESPFEEHNLTNAITSMFTEHFDRHTPSPYMIRLLKSLVMFTTTLELMVYACKVVAVEILTTTCILNRSDTFIFRTKVAH